MRTDVMMLLAVLSACGASPEMQVDAGLPDAGVIDAGHPADGCASTFGSVFTAAFGRVDGVVTAVVPPKWPCPLPNGDHAVIQVAIDGGVHRLVVNVKSDFGDPRIWLQRATKPLPAPAYANGWHPGLTLDYVALGLSSDAGWDLVDLDGATARILDAVAVGAEVSVYATSSGGSYAGSAHKIHRNGRGDDGAIVVDPQGPAPQWLFFRFDSQTF